MTEYGLVGKTLGHSFSASFFTEKFTAEHTNARYLNFELPDIAMLLALIEAHPNLRGLNVTIPYKQSVIPLLDGIDPIASAIGAVNTIKISHQGSSTFLIGYNTDAPGFLEGLHQSEDTLPDNALILGGTGGAAAAVIYALQSHGITTTIVSRHKAAGRLTYDEVTDDIIRSHRLIVNCTPLGMYPDVDSLPNIPYRALTPSHIAYDLVYNPPMTGFLKAARAQGCHILNGLPMLHAQALLSYRIWTSLE
ncbi:MAG: shikimate dehydrogenase [Muribaculaceae bacterium]|nr:shikimate dehydrogenase [Muribaculaceae bacterium]